MEFVSIEELAPHDPLLCKIERLGDFSLSREKVKCFYCADKNRPAVTCDPFKSFFLIYLFP